MAFYFIGPCSICETPMTFQDLRESVTWTPMRPWSYYYDDDEHRAAHRRCWKRLSESRKEAIRLASEKKFPPKCCGTRV